MIEFIEVEGMVHVTNVTLPERTLCGDAFDLASDDPDYEWRHVKRGPVTCENCKLIILHCRGVHIA